MRVNLFNMMLSAYIKDNLLNLHKKTVYYLTAQDHSIRDDKCILTISQLGLLYNLDNKIFDGNRFDNDLLYFFSKFRSRLSFILINRPNKYYLVRIIVTESSLNERDGIDKFMSKNLHKYNDAVFHFESDPEHKRIELKESKEIVAKGLQNWLTGYSDKKLITYTNDPTKVKVIEDMSGLDLSKCIIHNMSFDEKIEITDRLMELKNSYNGQR
jgi:hypothetical protein